MVMTDKEILSMLRKQRASAEREERETRAEMTARIRTSRDTAARLNKAIKTLDGRGRPAKKKGQR